MTIYVVKYLSLMQLTLFNSIFFFFCVEQCLPREGHYKLSARARVWSSKSQRELVNKANGQYAIKRKRNNISRRKKGSTHCRRFSILVTVRSIILCQACRATDESIHVTAVPTEHEQSSVICSDYLVEFDDR